MSAVVIWAAALLATAAFGWILTDIVRQGLPNVSLAFVCEPIDPRKASGREAGHLWRRNGERASSGVAIGDLVVFVERASELFLLLHIVRSSRWTAAVGAASIAGARPDVATARPTARASCSAESPDRLTAPSA